MTKILDNVKPLSNMCSVSIVEKTRCIVQITFSCPAPVGLGCSHGAEWATDLLAENDSMSQAARRLVLHQYVERPCTQYSEIATKRGKYRV